ncbi:loganic acid O-methyltransferase [Rosa sericea]
MSNTIRIADLGCSTGPNTFVTMKNILEGMQQKYRSQCAPEDHQTMPEFQVFFNDLVLNDFNTLFTSLPKDKQYFAAGVPGSFHGRLFPESSIHLVHTSLSLHWLSKLPEELQDKASPAWNKGRIHYTSAPNEVVDAYMSQFAKEMENFLDARAEELVPGGMMVMVLIGNHKGMPYSETPSGMTYDAISSSLMDMEKEGLIDEGQVDAFNLPLYAASLEELEGLVVKNGCFSIERMESSNPAAWLKGPVDITQCVMHVRAAMEGMFARHFGSHEVM